LLLLLSHHAPLERDARRYGILDALAEGVLDAEGLLVLMGPGGMAGAIMAAVVPGGGGVVWPPAVASLASARESAAALIDAAWRWLRGRGAVVVQSLTGPDLGTRCAFLLENGFRRVTTLVNFVHPLGLTADHLATPDVLELEPYSDARPGEFHDVLLRSYQGSLDCPEVNEARTVEQVIEGHKAQGRFDPADWWLARHRGEAVGVLLQVDQSSTEEREIAYVGVVPEARRRGHARELLVRSLLDTRAAGLERLLISVDERNVPAWRLYERLGFEEAGRQVVFLRLS